MIYIVLHSRSCCVMLTFVSSVLTMLSLALLILQPIIGFSACHTFHLGMCLGHMSRPCLHITACCLITDLSYCPDDVC